MSSDRFMSIARAASCQGVSVRTMRRYADNGRFAGVCPGGRRIFQLAELERAWHDPASDGGGGGSGVVVYAGVSSRGQQGEGGRPGPSGTARHGDRWGSASARVHRCGFRFERPPARPAPALGVWCTDEAVGVLMVEHPHRLARFGVRVIAHMLAVHAVQVSYVGEPEDGVSADAAPVRDMLAVVTSFGGRLYGRGSAEAKRFTAVLRQELGAA